MRSRDEIKVFLRDMQKRSVSDIVERAKEFATFAHAGQLDKAGQQYIYHPTRVAELTASNYSDDLLTAVAYMHDVVEDGGFTVSDLSVFFPPSVWKTVEILTRGKSEDRDVYIGKISKNLLATKVKMMDLRDNMDLGRLPYVTDKDYMRQSRYIDEMRFLESCLTKMEEALTFEERDTETYADLYM